MTYPYWVRIILDRWNKLTTAPSCALVTALFCIAATGQVPESLADAFRKKPTPANRAALERFAASHSRDQSGALALLSLGINDVEQERAEEALKNLRSAARRLPELADYSAYYLGSAMAQAGDFAGAAEKLESVWRHKPPSPLAPRAILLAAQALIQAGKAPEAAALLRKHFKTLQPSEAHLVLGMSLEAQQKLAEAAAQFQRVFYEYPTSGEAAKADEGLTRTREALGHAYPPVTAAAMLGRARTLMEDGQTTQARRELQRMITDLAGANRDVARVRLGACDYFARRNAAAYRYLKSLNVSSPEAEAERLYYLLATARRLEKDEEILSIAGQLNRRHPESPWRLEGLISAGNQFLVKNQTEHYEPLYRACAEGFPAEPRAAYCHWKVSWSEYLRRDPAAPEWLQDHLKKFPGSEKASAALYYLGRLAEKAGDKDAARVYYDAITDKFPFSYYAVLARDKLADKEFARAGESPITAQFVRTINFPSRSLPESYAPTALTRARLERVRLLNNAGLEDLSGEEMKFAARADGQGHILAMELARKAQKDGNPDQGIRLIKRYVPDYLFMAMEDAPDDFWRLAFPIPFREVLDRESRRRNLDPFLVAALVRQESEFNPRAVSPAKAYGLAQILPSTGRQISRKAGLSRFSTAMLYRPEVNLNLGTYYLRTLLDRLDGKWEHVLASYNAGLSRVTAWSGWGDFAEPSEFIETIPFTETRNYVQVVLRNADVYRRLYDKSRVAVRSSDGDSVGSNETALQGASLAPTGNVNRSAAAGAKTKKKSAGTARRSHTKKSTRPVPKRTNR